MRTRTLAAAVAAAALLPFSLLAAGPASAATKHDVLTYGKAGGTNVAAKSILTAGLSGKSEAVFASGSTATVSCKTSTITVKVVKNPTAKGTATESLTAQTFSKCSVSGSEASLIVSISLALTKGTYGVTVSDKTKSDPVVVSKPSATVKVTLAKSVGGGTLTCIYNAKSVSGAESNKHQTVTFTNQTLKLISSEDKSLCSALPSAQFSATYGPVVDNSVKGKKKPAVFVN
jgi:hypothetical protein